METFLCKECFKEFKTLKSLQQHLIVTHKYTKDDLKKLYDSDYIKSESEKVCRISGKPTEFISLVRGYKEFATYDKDVLRLTRSPFSVEYMVKVNGMSQDEAEKYISKYFKDHAEKNKEITKERLKEDPNFVRKQSRYCKEFWMEKGFSESESIEMAHRECEKNRNIYSKKLKEEPEKYKDVLTNQIGYWLKRGYSEKESKEKVSERQRTFTLPKLIEKYGKEKGLEIYNTRNENWVKKMEKYFREHKCSIATTSKPAMRLFNDIIKKIGNNKNLKYSKNISAYMSNSGELELINESLHKTYYFDFADIENKKIIEFNGDYWHCNPDFYKKDYYHKMKDKTAKEIWEYDNAKIQFAKDCGYDVLVIWEYDYNTNSDKILEECIDFLTKK